MVFILMNLLEQLFYHKAVSSFVPDYYIDYLEDSPWIHMPFEKYEEITIEELKKLKK